MKKIQKILAIVLTVAMVLAMSVSSFAAFDSTNPASSTADVVKVTGVADTTTAMSAYRIVKASNDANKVVTYELEDWVKDALKGTSYEKNGVYNVDAVIEDLGGAVGQLNGQQNPQPAPGPTTGDKNALLSTLSQATLPTTPNYTATIDTTTLEATFTGVEVGNYLVVATDTEKVYNPMQIAVGLTSDDDGNFNNVAALDTVGKYSDIPIDKKQTNADGIPNVSGDYAVGDTVTYEVTATIPNYDLAVYTEPTYVITDTLDKGLDPVEVLNVEIGGNTYTWKKGDATLPSYVVFDDANNTFEITLTEEIKNNPTDYLGKTVKITYETKLNQNAVTGFDPNTNTLKVAFKQDPKAVPTVKEIETHSYTFSIDGGVLGNIISKGWEIKKTGVGEWTRQDYDPIVSDYAALAGAEFSLYVDNGNGGWDLVDESKLKDNKGATQKSNPYTTTGDGRITFEGLDANKLYMLKETKAPAGYSINTKETTVEFIPTYDATTGKLASYQVELDGVCVADYGVDDVADPKAIVYNQGSKVIQSAGGDLEGTTEIKNTKLVSLPSTGGVGTTIFTVTGVALMILAAAMLLVVRRAKEQQ